MGMLSMVCSTILKSLRLAPSIAKPMGMPSASVSRLRLEPSLARSVGLRPVFSPSEGSLAHRAIHRQPVPVDAFKLVVLQQPTLPELQEYTGGEPRLEPAKSRRRAADSGGGQGVPLT